MHPTLLGEMARLRHEELLRDAEQVRRARSVRPRRVVGAAARARKRGGKKILRLRGISY
ncbi:MAG: hypothetical protein QOJ93_105 [Actinomycetota bacterium]|jgi:hypothetical protein|nr:hypothetical protein [Actinomycetota bacterium]